MEEINKTEMKEEERPSDPIQQESENNIKPPDEKCIYIFPNPEKSGKIRLGNDDYMPNVGSRILLSAMPNCGKRNLILNLIHRMTPKPSIVHIVHCDPLTIEYDCLQDMGIEFLMYDPSDFPTVENIDNPHGAIETEEEGEVEEKKIFDNQLVILDEVTTDQLGKVGSHRFERLVNFVCTHRNTTLICSIQSLLNIPPKARRAFNHYILWPQADTAVNQMAASRASVPHEVLNDLFTLCKSKYDFIWIDLDSERDSPYRFRLNFYEPITVDLDSSVLPPPRFFIDPVVADFLEKKC